MRRWCRACGHGVMELALEDIRREDVRQPVRSMEWDQSLVELTLVTSSKIPARVEEQWGRAHHRANCGLLPGLRHAWVSVDSTFFMWDYCSQDLAVTSVPADSVIISAGICPARPGVFGPHVQFLLVLATRLTVSLIGVQVNHAEVGTPGTAGAAGMPTNFHPAGHRDGQPGMTTRSSLRLIPLDGYSAPCDGALFYCIRHNQDGHIFLLCGAPQVFEVSYSRTSGWIHPKCRLIRHSVGWWPWARDFVSISPNMSGRVRLLECAPHGYIVTVDDSNTIRLLRLQDGGSHNEHSTTSLEELSSLTATEMADRLFTLTKMRLASRVIVYIFLSLGLDDHLHLHVVTAAGERLHFVCSAATQSGPSAMGPFVQAAHMTTKATQRFHGFWLQQVLPGNHNTNAAATSRSLSSTGLDKPRTACIEEDRDPCTYSGGVWVASVRRAGVTATDISVTARVDGATYGLGAAGSFDLSSVLKFDAQALDIVEEHDQSTGLRFICEAPLEGNLGALSGKRTFAVLFPDGVKMLQLAYRAQRLTHSPAYVQECCAHLMQLCWPPSSLNGAEGWTWTLDDARIPSFEEQQQYMISEKAVPPMHLGRWFGGLLRFLAIVLRPVWNSPLVVPTTTRPLLQFYKRRRVIGSCFALNAGLVQHVLGQLKPALQFVMRGHASQSSQPSSVSMGAGSRSRHFARKLVNNGEMQVQAQQLLTEVLDITKHLQQILGFLHVVYRHSAVQALMRSPALCGELLGLLCERPVGALVATPESLEPVVRLCAVFVAESGYDYLGGRPRTDDIKRDLHEMCPMIFEQANAAIESAQPLGMPTPHDSDQESREETRDAAAAGPSSGNLLRRYARYLPNEHFGDHQSRMERLIKTVANEDVEGAAELCAEQLQVLYQSAAPSPDRAVSLLGALLESIISRPASEVNTVLDKLLIQTRQLQFSESHEGFPQELPFVHGMVLALLLKGTEAKQASSAQACRRALEALLSSETVDIEAFLLYRFTTNAIAGECLAKFYVQKDQPDRATGILMQLAERPNRNFSLQRRIHFLELAKEQANSSAPWAREASQKLSFRMQVAKNVQLPLHHELASITRDSRLETKWRNAAKQRFDELQELRDLGELYRTAVEFGLYHLLLIMIDLAEPTPDRESISLIWLHVFCPPAASPYWSAEVSSPSALFPLILVRQPKAFYCIQAPQLSPDLVSHQQAFELRIISLFEELRHLTKVPGPCWDVRCIATLLEYCNCVWFRALDSSDTLVQGNGRLSSSRAWVALRVLSEKPFMLQLTDIVRFYAQMLKDAPTWLKDLKVTLPEGLSWPTLEDDDVQIHLSEVLLVVCNQWIVEIQKVDDRNPHALIAFREAWREIGEGLLADLGLRLNGLQFHHPAARRLLPEAIRLEGAGRHACSHTQAPAVQAFKAILQPERTSAAESSAAALGVETQ